jgi:AcrR family transcriptional regulator
MAAEVDLADLPSGVADRSAGPDPASTGGSRRDEILDAAATIFATSGVRASLKEIADACGILPGSLYHHFESKDAILVELVDRYRADLDAIAERARQDLRRADGPTPADLIVDMAEAIAACGLRHRAAMQLTLFDPPSGASQSLVEALDTGGSTIERAVRDVLRAGQKQGQVRDDIDVSRFAARLCGSMLHLGAGALVGAPAGDRITGMKARILLEGVAVRPPTDTQLDRSVALAAANEAIANWTADDETDDDERWTVLRSAARAEFGRRGYEVTTIRDIAAAAGLSTGTVYRLIGSKHELLLSVMRSFTQNITAGWEAVLASPSTTVEKLDALMWIDINVIDRFREEYRIQLAGLRDAPVDLAEHGWSFSRRLREIRALLAAGTKSGELQVSGGTADERAWCVLELIWMPENLVAGGVRPAHELARDTVLRGAAARG